MTVHRYGMGETDRIVRLGRGPGGSGFVVPNILQILKRVYGEDLVSGVYNHTGIEMLSGPLHPQKDTVYASDTVCASDKVGQSNSLERKEIKQNEGDKSVNSVLSEPHLPKETTSNYDQKDHSNSLDSETLVCRSVTVPSNTAIVLSRKANGPEITPDKAENICESGTRPERQICKNLRVVHTNVNGWTTRNVGHELRCMVLGSYDADLICVNKTHLKPGEEISMPGYKFVNCPRYQIEVLGTRAIEALGY